MTLGLDLPGTSGGPAASEDKRSPGGAGDPLAGAYIHAHRRGSIETWVSAVRLVELAHPAAALVLQAEGRRRYRDDFENELALTQEKP
jgi:sugar/nucleoside kinase (ribokinase family)